MRSKLLLIAFACTLFLASAQLAPDLYQEQGASLPFTDIEHSQFVHAITYLDADGLIGGFPDGTFRPNRQMTRAEFLVIVMRAAVREGIDVANPAAPCPAADLESWYAGSVCEAIKRGVVDGSTDDLRPDDAITYAEALKVMLGAFGFEPSAAAQDEPWFAPYVSFADVNGVLPAGSYNPSTGVSRELAANLLYRVLVLVQDPSSLGAFDERAALEALVAAAMLHQPGPTVVADSRFSAGCLAPRRGMPASLHVTGRERSLISFVPGSYDTDRPHSLVVAFHGRTNSNAQVRNYMDLERHARDTIIVYPAGVGVSTGGYSWSDAGDRADTLRDYALFDMIVDSFGDSFCIDLNRVFVVGHSLGAWFANSLACARADVVRGAATLAGGISAGDCPQEVAAMVLHNPNDHLVPFRDGELARDAFLRNNRLEGTVATPVPGPFSCAAHQLLPDDRNPVVWCPHRIDYPFGSYHNPHGWPTGTGQAIMEFFTNLN